MHKIRLVNKSIYGIVLTAHHVKPVALDRIIYERQIAGSLPAAKIQAGSVPEIPILDALL
jgi:hypothetical protein